MSTERIYQAVLEVAAQRQGSGRFQTHLDIGAGRGGLIKLFRDRFQTQSSACDYTDQLRKLPGQKVEMVDLNQQPLPYPDASFDIVTATEVVEHLERYLEVLRDIAWVTKPGGRLHVN